MYYQRNSWFQTSLTLWLSNMYMSLSNPSDISIKILFSLTSIHNIAFSKEKVVSSEARVKYAQIKHYLEIKTVQKSFKQICL